VVAGLFVALGRLGGGGHGGLESAWGDRRPLGALQLVAESPNCLDVVLPNQVGLDFLSQPLDANVNRFLAAFKVIAPGKPHELRTGQDTIRIHHQGREKGDLPGRQRHAGGTDADLHLVQVETQVADDDAAVGVAVHVRDTRSPQERMNTCQQLAWRVRLDDVFVSEREQAADYVVLIPAVGDNHHRYMRFHLPDLLAQPIAVVAGQQCVDENEIDVLPLEGLQCRLGLRRCDRLVTVALKKDGRQLELKWIFVENQNGGDGKSLSSRSIGAQPSCTPEIEMSLGQGGDHGGTTAHRRAAVPRRLSNKPDAFVT
jgi:hypothetical protein